MKALSTLIVLFGVFLAFTLSSPAQEAPAQVTITKIDYSTVSTPGYAVQATPPPLPPESDVGKWLRVDFTFEVKADRPGKFLNELQFKVYIEVDDLAVPTDREGTPAVLTGETTFVNLPDKRDQHGVFFVHPYTVKRFGGETAFNYKDKKNIHVEAYVDGQLVASKDAHDDDANWFGPLKKINGMVIPREASPWALVDIDQYPPVKLRTGNQ